MRAKRRDNGYKGSGKRDWILVMLLESWIRLCLKLEADPSLFNY